MVKTKPKSRASKKRVLFDEDDDEEYKHDQTSEDEPIVDAADEAESESDAGGADPVEDEDDTLTSSKDLSQFKASRKASSSKPALKAPLVKRPSPKPSNSSSSPLTAGSGKHSQFDKKNEERYQWLEVLRDAEGHLQDDPEYDPRTLFIPKSAWAKFTPFEKQYWEIKSKMWNTVVFFKKGKFFELYENDADIAHNVFDLKLAGGGRANMRLAGIPEMSFDHWAASFIAKGYKVAKVDQKESALAKEMRDQSKGKKEEKIVKRELSCVLTGGTLTDESMLVDDMSTYCMCIKQVENSVFGICFTDTATGAFYISQFEDDADYSQFETILAQTRPKELLLERGGITQKALRIIKNNTSVSTQINYLKPNSEFWDTETAYEEVIHGRYFGGQDLDDMSNYPQILKEILQDKDRSVVLRAYGGLLWYLKSCLIDRDLISLGNIQWYDGIQRETSMILDGQSLQNLEIFANTFDGGSDGTLFKLLNRCLTPFGKRRLKRWVCHPLMDVRKINLRLDTVEFLNANNEIQETVGRQLSSLPDLERLLSRIHAGQLRVKDFVRVLESFERIYDMVVGIHDQCEECVLLKGLLESLPESLQKCLPKWTDAFDREKAKRDGELIPEKGVEPEFDESTERIKLIEEELTKKLREYRRELGSQEVVYKDSGKEIYLIEVPAKIKNVPDDWIQMAATAKVRRYWSPHGKKLVRQLQEARELHKIVLDNLQAKLYARFDEDYNVWLQAVQAVANIDCLVSLAKTSNAIGTPSCRPELVDQEDSILKFDELRHPCFSGDSAEFIPNDISLGGDDASITLLTGANAAGKSTVLRMTCVAVIMAQIGCFVPAENAKLTPVDRIMTRLGANDNIFAGKSTFYIELSETKRILAEATNRSLLVLDELGRGGSSSDGFAIAEAVLHHIATHVNALGFFATHYGTLVNSFKHHPQVTPRRMAILVDDEGDRRVTFLYKLENGVAPGSFGMHVATMCGVDKSIVDRAQVAAEEFEHTSRMKRMLEITKDDSSYGLGLQSDFVWATTANRSQKGLFSRKALLSMLAGAQVSC